MRVYLGWSGPCSEQAAGLLQDWLPRVLPEVEPVVPIDDLNPVARWNPSADTPLNTAHAGIFVVTRDNHASPWLNFEAGVFAGSAPPRSVVALLLDATPGEIAGPLSCLPTRAWTKQDMAILLADLASWERPARGHRAVPAAFAAWWPQLERDMRTLLTSTASAPGVTADTGLEAMVAQVLHLSRRIDATVRSREAAARAEPRRTLAEAEPGPDPTPRPAVSGEPLPSNRVAQPPATTTPTTTAARRGTAKTSGTAASRGAAATSGTAAARATVDCAGVHDELTRAVSDHLADAGVTVLSVDVVGGTELSIVTRGVDETAAAPSATPCIRELAQRHRLSTVRWAWLDPAGRLGTVRHHEVTATSHRP